MVNHQHDYHMLFQNIIAFDPVVGVEEYGSRSVSYPVLGVGLFSSFAVLAMSLMVGIKMAGRTMERLAHLVNHSVFRIDPAGE